MCWGRPCCFAAAAGCTSEGRHVGRSRGAPTSACKPMAPRSRRGIPGRRTARTTHRKEPARGAQSRARVPGRGRFSTGHARSGAVNTATVASQLHGGRGGEAAPGRCRCGSSAHRSDSASCAAAGRGRSTSIAHSNRLDARGAARQPRNLAARACRRRCRGPRSVRRARHAARLRPAEQRQAEERPGARAPARPSKPCPARCLRCRPSRTARPYPSRALGFGPARVPLKQRARSSPAPRPAAAAVVVGQAAQARAAR
jgi:hypothetical protein